MNLTFKEFKEEFRKKHWSDKYFNYLACVFMVIVGTTLIIVLGKEALNNTNELLVICAVGLFLIASGIYGMFLLKRKYKITNYNNELGRIENIKLINEVRNSFKQDFRESNDNVLVFQYWQNWWKSPCEVYIFADEKLIAFNVEPLKGVFDFGAAKARRKRILKILSEN